MKNKIKEKLNSFFSKLHKKSPPRGSDDLFRSGDVFKATDEELRNILREVSTQFVLNESVRHREIIRALVVNNIQNQRHSDEIDGRNSFLTLIIIILTCFSIWSATRLEGYIELATRAERISQEQSIQNAITRCKQSPEMLDSGIYNVDTGTSATCAEVLRM
jgi:hypothetical protein